MLKQEVLERIKQSQFEPAVYNHHRVSVYIDETVSYGIVDGKTRLRIFLNQEEDALTKGHDFIAPQLAFIPGSEYKGIYYPPAALGVAGVASVTMDLDEKGKMKSQKVTYKHPPGLGFARR
ncbi:MAG: hypothetical protein M3Q89_08925 [Verrucomicrobiota bacterium]|nr:hypothetical protein [Verrucomicrobiota bacterium]